MTSTILLWVIGERNHTSSVQNRLSNYRCCAAARAARRLEEQSTHIRVCIQIGIYIYLLSTRGNVPVGPIGQIVTEHAIQTRARRAVVRNSTSVHLDVLRDVRSSVQLAVVLPLWMLREAEGALAPEVLTGRRVTQPMLLHVRSLAARTDTDGRPNHSK
jgi:hypothetical protein